MPAGRGSQTIAYGQVQAVESMNAASMPHGGELGQALGTTNGKYYQLIQLDSGATASTATGVVAAGDLAYWKDRASYIVTNDIAQAQAAESTSNNSKRNVVAGVFTAAVTAGYFGVIQQQGYRATVKSDGGGDFVSGDYCVAGNNTTSAIDRTAAGTAPPNTPVGIVAGSESNGFTPVWLNLPVAP